MARHPVAAWPRVTLPLWLRPPKASECRVPPEADPRPHPLPPPHLEHRALTLYCREDGPMAPSIQAVHEPLYSGHSGHSRFDDPARGFGVLYGGDSLNCCLVETLGGVTGSDLLISRHMLAERRLASVLPLEPLQLVDLTPTGLTRLRADNRLSDGGRSVRVLGPPPSTATPRPQMASSTAPVTTLRRCAWRSMNGPDPN